jgi:multiple sugar transport system permease protein
MSRLIKQLPYMRDIGAAATVAIFMFPIVWTAIDSIKPNSALFNKDGITFLHFSPTLNNYAVVLGQVSDVLDARPAISSTIAVAIGATCLALAIALPAAFALWRFGAQRRSRIARTILFAWMLPPIVLIGPLFHLYHATGLFDTHVGLILAEAAIHVPFAILVLKSFFDDLSPETTEAAMLDGASEGVIFRKIAVPMIRSGIAATAVLLFIFCWTEFFLAVFLAAFVKLLPIQVIVVNTASGGLTMALSTAVLLPCFIFVLLVQKHLARGFSLGWQK